MSNGRAAGALGETNPQSRSRVCRQATSYLHMCVTLRERPVAGYTAQGLKREAVHCLGSRGPGGSLQSLLSPGGRSIGVCGLFKRGRFHCCISMEGKRHDKAIAPGKSDTLPCKWAHQTLGIMRIRRAVVLHPLRRCIGSGRVKHSPFVAVSCKSFLRLPSTG